MKGVSVVLERRRNREAQKASGLAFDGSPRGGQERAGRAGRNVHDQSGGSVLIAPSVPCDDEHHRDPELG